MLAPLLLSTLLAIVPEPVAPLMNHVRPQTDITRVIIEDARRRSSTIASMLHQIEQSDVIIFIDFQFDPPFPGHTVLFSASPLARFVRVVVDIGLPPQRRMELIGHELQHVLEIVAAPDVRDESGMRRLFAEIGWEVKKGSYETRAAQVAEGLVRGDTSKRGDPAKRREAPRV